ncbi:hypothetical protein TWF694_008204 [Orbilia ellipsospora]|uniref:Uncharacterized protein n=1 Tax=Orbilia ellipsospora TaxID=2528407 RepID=A0AAV9XFD0_9PEZI
MVADSTLITCIRSQFLSRASPLLEFTEVGTQVFTITLAGGPGRGGIVYAHDSKILVSSPTGPPPPKDRSRWRLDINEERIWFWPPAYSITLEGTNLGWEYPYNDATPRPILGTDKYKWDIFCNGIDGLDCDKFLASARKRK